MEEKLKHFSGCFESEEIKDADKFEDDAVEFRNWFVEFKYDVIQPRFDLFLSICEKVAMHYRPKVQQCGCDCLYILMKEAAPAQIANKRENFQKIYDKLMQIGHEEVLPSLVPAVAEKFDIVYRNTADNNFNEFFYHMLETWSREATTAKTAFVIAQHYPKIVQHAGMAIARYIEPSIKIIAKRVQQSKSKAHIKEYMTCIKELVKQARPVVAPLKEEISELIKTALENTEEADKVKEETQQIEEMLNDLPSEPQNWSIN